MKSQAVHSTASAGNTNLVKIKHDEQELFVKLGGRHHFGVFSAAAFLTLAGPSHTSTSSVLAGINSP